MARTVKTFRDKLQACGAMSLRSVLATFSGDALANVLAVLAVELHGLIRERIYTVAVHSRHRR